MSVAAVNTAVWNWLKPVQGITELYQAAPMRLLGGEWEAGGVPGTPAYLHITDISERRITVPANRGGQKGRTYSFVIVCLYQWLIPTDLSATGTGDKDGWVTGQHQLIDNIVARIEADPTFGTGPGGVIFEAGNQDGGLKVGKGQPVLDPSGGKVMAWCHVEFTVTEIVVV